jgi:metal-dependent amidase/aminoacylase/carboxypeptidase family protein
MYEEIKNICQRVSEKNKGTCKVNILKGYPVLYNNEKLTEQTRAIAAAYAGPENILDVPIRMGSEDFAYYSHQVPACFYRFGVGNKVKGITSGVHTPSFNIEESALKTSIGLMSWIALSNEQISK